MDQLQLKTEERLAQVELDTKIIRKDIETISKNHLFHIEKDLASLDQRVEKIDGRVWMVLFGIITLIASTVLTAWLT